MNDFIDDMITNIDIDLFISKGLMIDDKLTDRYYKLLKNYKILFDKYLLYKLPLKKYDDILSNSDLVFSPVKKENMDFYQMFSTMGLNYIYLRSRLYVEKLSLKDILLIVLLDESNLFEPNQELFELVDKTYKSVIDCRVDNFDEICKISYADNHDNYWINSDELVFGIRYDEFAECELSGKKEWLDYFYKHLDFMGEIINDMNKKCSDILGVKVNFLYYDDVSIMSTMKKIK